MRVRALLAALAVGLSGCGAVGGGAAAAHGPAPHAVATAPVMRVTQPTVRPLELTGAPPAPATGGGGAPEPARVRLPAIGVDSGLARLGLNGDGTIQVPPDPNQAGWYTGGPAPGEPGPAVIVGHLDSYTGPAVFHRLSATRPGEEVWVSRADGSRLRFVVQRVATFPVDGFPTQDVYGVTAEPGLRLITCGGAFSFAQRRYLSN